MVTSSQLLVLAVLIAGTTSLPRVKVDANDAKVAEFEKIEDYQQYEVTDFPSEIVERKDDIEKMSTTQLPIEFDAQTEIEETAEDIEEEPEMDYAVRLPHHARVLISREESNFDCTGRKMGMYADHNLDCKVVHVCHPFTSFQGFLNRKVFSFVCDDGTVFDQETQKCSNSEIALPCFKSPDFFELQNKVNDMVFILLSPFKKALVPLTNLKTRIMTKHIETDTEEELEETDSTTETVNDLVLRHAEDGNNDEIAPVLPDETILEEKLDETNGMFSNYTPLKTTGDLIKKKKQEIENQIAQLAMSLSSLKEEEVDEADEMEVTTMIAP